MPELSQQSASVLENSRLLNAVIFQFGWFSCILGGDLVAVVVMATILFTHSQFFMRSAREWLLFLVVAILGISLDSFWVYTGFLVFPGIETFIPVWLICLWLVFATSLCHCFQWLQKRLVLASLLGAFAGPASYLSGAAMADVIVSEPQSVTIPVMAIAWALLFPLLLIIARELCDD
jgi:hypothetical protein